MLLLCHLHKFISNTRSGVWTGPRTKGAQRISASSTTVPTLEPARKMPCAAMREVVQLLNNYLEDRVIGQDIVIRIDAILTMLLWKSPSEEASSHSSKERGERIKHHSAGSPTRARVEDIGENVKFSRRTRAKSFRRGTTVPAKGPPICPEIGSCSYTFRFFCICWLLPSQCPFPTLGLSLGL